MRIILMALAIVSATTTPSWAGEVHIKVDGMVCDFCAQAIAPLFTKRDEIKDVDISLDTKIVKVFFEEGQSLPDEELTKIIVDSGYAVNTMTHPEKE